MIHPTKLVSLQTKLNLSHAFHINNSHRYVFYHIFHCNVPPSLCVSVGYYHIDINRTHKTTTSRPIRLSLALRHTMGSSLLKLMFCDAQKSFVIGKQLKYEHTLQSYTGIT